MLHTFLISLNDTISVYRNYAKIFKCNTNILNYIKSDANDIDLYRMMEANCEITNLKTINAAQSINHAVMLSKKMANIINMTQTDGSIIENIIFDNYTNNTYKCSERDTPWQIWVQEILSNVTNIICQNKIHNNNLCFTAINDLINHWYNVLINGITRWSHDCTVIKNITAPLSSANESINFQIEQDIDNNQWNIPIIIGAIGGMITTASVIGAIIQQYYKQHQVQKNVTNKLEYIESGDQAEDNRSNHESVVKHKLHNQSHVALDDQEKFYDAQEKFYDAQEKFYDAPPPKPAHIYQNTYNENIYEELTNSDRSDHESLLKTELSQHQIQLNAEVYHEDISFVGDHNNLSDGVQ
jgi:hypothetical protein